MSLSPIHIFQQPLEGILEGKAFLKKSRPDSSRSYEFHYDFFLEYPRKRVSVKIYGNVLSISLRARCYASSYVCRAMLFYVSREYNGSLFKVKFQLQLGKALYRRRCYLSSFYLYLPKLKW